MFLIQLVGTAFVVRQVCLKARLFNQLLDILRYYENFEIDDTTGAPLSRREIIDVHYERLRLLQRCCFADFPDQPALKTIALLNVSALDTREAMLRHLDPLSLEVSGLRESMFGGTLTSPSVAGIFGSLAVRQETPS